MRTVDVKLQVWIQRHLPLEGGQNQSSANIVDFYPAELQRLGHLHGDESQIGSYAASRVRVGTDYGHRIILVECPYARLIRGLDRESQSGKSRSGI